MNLQRLFFFILILVVGCRTVSAERGVNGTATGTNPINSQEPAKVEEAVDGTKQIDLNKAMLLTFSDETKRIDVASLLLFNQNPYARQVLIDTLNLTNNSPARMAVCKALIKTRTSQQEIPNKYDFIEPLLNIFSTKVDAEAKLAADAILIYKDQEIGPLLDKLVSDPEKPAAIRINVIEALKKVWEKQAIIRLYKLMDDPSQEVSSEAGKALRSLGFQVGSTTSEREKNIADIQNREIVEVLKDLLRNQETQLDAQKADFELLRKFTLSVLDDAYLGIGVDDASRGKFIKKYLSDDRTWVKSWALDKVRQWRGTPQTLIPADIEPVIIALVSDPSREIRLKTVGLIGLLQPMKAVDLAAKLLTQFEAEQDDQVKIELLDLMGIVCSTALSQTSPVIKVTPDLRQRVLGYASDFLSKDDPAKAKIGAKVMKQLLEREGMQEQEIKVYLGQLTDRYNRQKQDPNSALMADLLNAMVGLVAENSASREYARKAFEPIFKEALNYDTDFIRETAIDGLGYINKAEALKFLHERIDKERSEKAKLKIIEFAKEVGGRDDLEWLAVRLGQGTNSEAKQTWAAMMKIFSGVEIDVLNNWESRLVSVDSIYHLSESQEIDFLKIVLSKTPDKEKPKYYEQIASRSFNTGQYEQAANYYNLLYTSNLTAADKDRILPKYLDSCLRCQNEKAVTLVMEYLSNNVFNPDHPIIKTIENYFTDTKVGADKNNVLKALKGITLAQPKPGWQAKLQLWTEMVNKPETEKPAVAP
jgi:HEAT repeat protein